MKRIFLTTILPLLSIVNYSIAADVQNGLDASQIGNAETTSDKSLILIVIFFGFTACIGLFLSVMQIVNWRRALRSAIWPQAIGVICESFSEKKMTPHGETSVAVIKYEYEVGGTKFSSSQVSFDSLRNEEISLLEKYPVELNVTVYYNPNKHEISVLETGKSIGMIFLFVLGLFSFIFSLLLIYKGAGGG